MFRKIFGFVFSLLVFSLIAVPVHAQSPQQFSTDYKVTYDVDLSGSTEVTEKVSITNLTDTYYASSFSLIIGATKISDVTASDSSGPLQISTAKEGTQTRMTINFPAQIAGKGKVYTWVINFKSNDFAQNQGKIWQVSVPKIATTDGVNSYDLDLKVPLEFGDPTSILPDPKSRSEENGKIDLQFSKDQLTQSGILASFGSNQFFDFALNYHLSNNSLLPSVVSVPLPPDTNFQEVAINTIDPKPENVTYDGDGNVIAWFKLNQYSSEDVKVSGQAKLYIDSRDRLPLELSPAEVKTYTSPQRFWEVDNPLISAKVSDILNGKRAATNQQKAKLINDFVVNALKFNGQRSSGGDFSRLGGLTALNNPDDSLCSEFTDLFITLSRGAGVPARELDGYAYTSNADLRPLSFDGNSLHCWPEYFDPSLGWVMVDPTWQNTSGGVDYFSKFDLNHLVLDIRGASSDQPTPTNQVSVNFSGAQFNPHPQLQVSFNAPSQFYAGFPSKLKVEIANTGSSAILPSDLSLSSSRVQINGKTSFETPKIPPFGKLDYTFSLKTPNLVSDFDDDLVLNFDGQRVDQKISIRPFFANKLLPVVVFSALGVMVVLYFGILSLHIVNHRRKYHSKK